MEANRENRQTPQQLLEQNQAMLKEIEKKLIIIKKTNKELQKKIIQFNCTAICYRYKMTYPMDN